MSEFSSSTREKLIAIHQEYCDGKCIKQINLANAGLTEFPMELLKYKDTVEFINFGGNKLSSLPSEIIQFEKLRILFFAENNFSRIPLELGKLPNLYMLSFKNNKLEKVDPDSLSPSLKWLILTDNRITELPREIGKLTGLRKFMMAGNQIESLPEELSNCKDLELFRISVNNLTSLPDWLLSMPKLSWIALSGNAFPKQNLAEANTHQDATLIQWNEIEVKEKLGEGASGFVYRGNLSCGNEVAIKLFKGLITSDGLAEDEIEVTKRLGDHPNFLKMIGQVKDHPEGKLGILLPLLDTSEYTVLGNPPSFDSITRDTYPTDISFRSDFIFTLLQGISSAAKHLHECGILHGDLYAHNILTKTNGEVLLTDFGAASLVSDFFGKGIADKLEKIEVRAFGCLIDDLLSRAEVLPGHENKIEQLHQLKYACLLDFVDSRPTFREICNTLL